MTSAGVTRRTLMALPVLASPILKVGMGRAAFRRGVGIYHIAGSSDRLRPDRTYVQPFFSAPPQQMADSEMRALAAAGFDFVRLPVAPDLAMRSSDAQRVQLDAALAALIRRFKAAGLKTVIDLHSSRALPGYTDTKLVADPNSLLFQQYTAAVEEFARLALKLDADVALELFNEPPEYSRADMSQWALMQAHLHDRARAIAPRLPLILTGARGGSRDGLLAIDPRRYRGSDIYWSFHYYDPHVFTHQGVEGTRYSGLHDIPWPPSSANRAALLSQAAINSLPDKSVGSDLIKYATLGKGAADIRNDMSAVSAWADRHGVPHSRLFMGEFGVSRSVGKYKGAPEDDRLRWIRTVRETAEQAGFAWSYWAYSGPGGMTLANEYPARTLDQATLQALGLASQSI